MIHTSVDIEDGTAWIELDDGKVNAMSVALMGELNQALDLAEEAGACAVLTGRKGIFSAGFDLATFNRGADAIREMLRTGAELVLRLLEFPRPVLVACSGHAYPMGAFLMLAADVRFAVAGDWRIGMNEVAIGLSVPEFALELARHRLTPPGVSRITTAAMFGPEEARRLGYVDHVVTQDVFSQAVRDEATRLQTLDKPSYVATKSRINRRAAAAIRAAIASEM